MQSLRVLFFNYEFPPLGGGGANANAYLFREFARMPGLCVDCVTSAAGEADETSRFADNITLYRLSVGKKDRHYWRQREVLTWLRKAFVLGRRLQAQKDYDLCHAFFGFPSGAPAWAARKRQPYIVSLRGSDVPGFNPRLAFQYAVLRPFFRKIWRNARAVVANSEGLRELARRFEGALDCGVIPNGIDAEAFHPGADSQRQAGHLLCVSRLVGRKGVQHLVEAMPDVLCRHPGAFLTVVGEGDLLQELKARSQDQGIADCIDWRGYVPHDELPALYRKAQLFVQPSYYEGMSNTVLEAMASGLPVVASGQGGREELLGDNARLVDYGDAGALARALVELLARPEDLVRMGERSRQIALEYSWAAVARSYHDLYLHVAAEV